jgi:hypothetical protein
MSSFGCRISCKKGVMHISNLWGKVIRIEYNKIIEWEHKMGQRVHPKNSGWVQNFSEIPRFSS